MEKKTEIYLELAGNEQTARVDIADLIRVLGLKGFMSPESVALVVEKDDMRLIAKTDTNEQDYPAITIDGEANGDAYYLAQAELPNESYPTCMTARLYAGNSEYEVDSPIAITLHECTDSEMVKRRKAAYDESYMTKLVYVDYDEAQAKQWKSSENMVEHREDE